MGIRYKLDKNGTILRNKARWYNQQEGVDFNETCSLVARLDAITMLLVFSCILNF